MFNIWFPVEGELSPNKSPGESLAALFPGGSITGCPKVVTMAAIDQLEVHLEVHGQDQSVI